jgi:quercetin dioxygenase-like cupin family protein
MKLSDIICGALGLILSFSAANAALAKDASKQKAKSSNSATANLDSEKCKVSVVYDHALPNVPGKSIKGVLVEYEPGGSTPCHTHPKSAFIYATVLEGAITSQVNDGPVTTYKKGENFSENPGDKHGVSKNASNSKPAKLLAVFIVDTNESELTTPCKD